MADHTEVDIDSVSSGAVRAIADACLDGEKLPGELILCGVLESAAALWLAIYKEPGGMFQYHGDVLFYLYYCILIVVVLFGLAEASVGFWVSGDLGSRRAVGRKMMWFSLFPLVLVSGLGGFAFASPK